MLTLTYWNPSFNQWFHAFFDKKSEREQENAYYHHHQILKSPYNETLHQNDKVVIIIARIYPFYFDWLTKI